MWSDPEDDLETWGQGARGAGYLFGSKVVSGFCHINNLDLICRSHQLVQGMLTERRGGRGGTRLIMDYLLTSF